MVHMKNSVMDIKLLDYKKANQHILSTECILCTACIHSCPQNAIDCNNKPDLGGKERLNYKRVMKFKF